MAKNNCRKGFVEVPQMTLNALKSLLFGNEGVDLSSIINDLKPNENDELTAINVGLVYKGLTPEVDKSTRYYRDYMTLVKWEFVGVSLILGVVKVKRFTKWFDQKTQKLDDEWKEDDRIQVYGFDQWLENSTKEDDIISELKERFPAPKPQESAI